MTGVVVVPDERTIKLESLEDLSNFTRTQLQRIIDRTSGGNPSLGDEQLLYKWTEFSLKLMISMGMDLDSRLTEAEDIIFNERLRAERKG